MKKDVSKNNVSFQSDKLKKKVKDLIEDAKKENRIKPLSDAFKNNSVENEEHKGKISSYW